MKKLKVGIAGPGGIAQGVHIPNYQKRPDVEVTAVYSRSAERGRLVADKFGIPESYSDYKEMLERAGLDAVSVCVPNKHHAELTIQALEAGLHVLCEKPPAITAEEAIRMKQAAEKAGKILSYNFHYRHSEEVEAIRTFIDHGQLGDIYSVRVHALRRRGIPGWGVFTNKELQGGGPLIDIGVHMLDTALYLMDYPVPDQVLAVSHQRIGTKESHGLMGSWDPEAFTVEDSLMSIIRFQDGQSLVLETSFALNMEQAERMTVELFGDRAGASVFPPQLFEERAGMLTNTDVPFLHVTDKHERSIADFVDSCFGRKQPLIRLSESVMLQQLIDALYESAENGKAVSLK